MRNKHEDRSHRTSYGSETHVICRQNHTKHIFKKCCIDLEVVWDLLLLCEPDLLLTSGRAGSTWRARAVFRTRSLCVPLMTRTRWPGSACLRWRRTSWAGRPSRSNQAPHMVSLQSQAAFTYAAWVGSKPASYWALCCLGIKGKIMEVFNVLGKLLIHRLLPSCPADNCHMVWKLSHSWSKYWVAIIHARGDASFFSFSLHFDQIA